VSKSAQIRELLAQGLVPKEIAAQLGVAPSLVYVVAQRARKRAGGAQDARQRTLAPKTRPRAAVSATDPSPATPATPDPIALAALSGNLAFLVAARDNATVPWADRIRAAIAVAKLEAPSDAWVAPSDFKQALLELVETL